MLYANVKSNLFRAWDLGQRFGTSKMHLSSPVALAAVRSKAVVLLLLMIVTPFVGFCNCPMFCCAFFVSVLVLMGK